MKHHILFVLLFIMLWPVAVSGQSKERLIEELLEQNFFTSRLNQMDAFYQMGVDAYLGVEPEVALPWFEKGLDSARSIGHLIKERLEEVSSLKLLQVNVVSIAQKNSKWRCTPLAMPNKEDDNTG